MNTKTLLAGILLLPFYLQGCSFFDEPLTDLGDLTPAAPEPELAPLPSQTPPPLPPASSTTTTPAPASTATPTQQAASQPMYFTVAGFDDIPENVDTLAIVHLTNTGSNRNTNRELAFCKALTAALPVTPVSQIPAGSRVLVWPVSETNGDSLCIELLTRYEPIDISAAVATRVNDRFAGPFVLTRSMKSDARMIYDMSFSPRATLGTSITDWQSMVVSPQSGWPEYHRSR